MMQDLIKMNHKDGAKRSLTPVCFKGKKKNASER